MAGITESASSEEMQSKIRLRLKYHPMRVFIYLLLVGITSAFVFLSAAYFATTVGTDFNKFKLPLLFHANTIIILVSSYTINQTRKTIRNDDWKGYVNALLVTAGLGIAFTVFQVIAWKQMVLGGMKFSSNIASDYLYVISGLHLAHLVVGVVLLAWFSVQALQKNNDPVKMLMFESDPFSKMKVDLICTYWHFVDGLWLYIYLFFVFNIYVLAR